MPEKTEQQQVPRTDPRDAKERFDDGSALFVDVRPAEQYREGHIAGALSLPLATEARNYCNMPRDRDVILY